MSSLPRLPRPDPGYVLKAADIRLLSDAIRRGWPVAAVGGGIQIDYSDAGAFISATASPFLPRLMVVTTTITAMNYTTGVVGGGGTSGQACDAVFTISTKKLVSSGGTPQDVYSIHEKTFLAGAFIAALTWSGVLWCFDVDRCADYV